MSPEDAALDRLLAERLWPWVEQVMDAWALPGVAICAVRGEAVVARGFGTRDVRTGEPVTGDTLFHLASISKPFVATAALQLVDDGALELDAPIAPLLPELRWADERARGITLRHLLSHRSGLGDVHDYGWDDPEFDDDALARFAAEVAGWRLERDPGNAFAYSNAAYELLGHLLATVTGSSFEALLAERVLRPLGMATSTFLRHDVPPALEAAPHIGQPAAVPEGAYPYTRQHAPSSSLHSSAAELGRWLVAHLDGRAGLSPELHREMWAPQAEAGGVWHAQIALGWFLGTIRGRTVVSHSGEDPGFATNHGLVPDERVGFAVLGNSNLVPVELSEATLAVLLGEDPGEPPLPPAVVPVGRELEVAGPEAAEALFRLLAAERPPRADLDEPGFDDATWPAVELHRPELVRPLLELWLRAQPESADAWATAAWSHEVEGRAAEAVEHLRRALELDPEHEDAAARLRRLRAAPASATSVGSKDRRAEL
ncbi:serine hydrolase domain-containing protein [Agrococcus carbonis]|uniref:CubicO group peptidase, beta-lactamase class C family n=1 Tax=Agrococcus carbonis TaxID=684552 RepID=A0A1H1N4C9_9MICO|nr:serine hydrolase [Agrococcus carbonis]SDR93812.1 CubicO group peptidase, beta-lactamase class C family [Agrococcus carbonis]